MIARLQQVITLSLLLIGAVCLFLGWQSGHASWAVIALVMIAFGHMAFLGIEFLLLAFVARRSPTLRPGSSAMLRAWFGEAHQAPRAFCWRQPFRSRSQPDSMPSAPGHQRGVVLVHGMLCNRGFWNPWMSGLRASDVPFMAVSLEHING